MSTLYPVDWSYSVITVPEKRGLDICDVKNWLRIDEDDESDDRTLEVLIDGVVKEAQNLSGRTMITTKLRTFRNGFSDTGNFIAGGETPIELRRSPFIDDSTIALSYLVSGSFVALVEDTDYFVETSDDYVRVRPTTDNEWPVDIDEIEQSVKVEFFVGYGTAATSVPSDLTLGMLRHVASDYENRGESNGKGIPEKSAQAYRRNRVLTV